MGSGGNSWRKAVLQETIASGDDFKSIIVIDGIVDLKNAISIDAFILTISKVYTQRTA